MTKEQEIFETWNSFKGHKNNKGTWKAHNELTGYRRGLIRDAVRLHGFQRVLAAIVIYHKVWHGAEYKWTYGWDLFQFLTRKKNGLVQIERFFPDNFIEYDYLTEGEKTRRIREANEEAKRIAEKYDLRKMKSVNDAVPVLTTKEKYARLNELKLAEEWDKGPFHRNLITKHRPDFAKKMRGEIMKGGDK